VLTDLQQVGRAMKDGKLRGTDLCMQHEFAPPRELADICREHFSLRRLCDPVGAYASLAASAGGILLAVLYVIGWFVGLAGAGQKFLLMGVFGILGVALTPTVIGLFVVYLIAGACGVPLLWAYLGTLAAALVGVVIFFVGRAIGYGVGVVAGKLIRLQERRLVRWD
jgi:hypothetical protein